MLAGHRNGIGFSAERLSGIARSNAASLILLLYLLPDQLLFCLQLVESLLYVLQLLLYDLSSQIGIGHGAPAGSLSCARLEARAP